MGAFARQWPNAAIHVVETNYRSTPDIVAAAHLIDRSMTDRFERVLRASRDSIGCKPALVHVADIFAEAEHVADAVAELRDGGTSLRECAVLIRAMRNARHVEAAPNARGIPYVFLGGIRIYEAAHIKDVLSVPRIGRTGFTASCFGYPRSKATLTSGVPCGFAGLGPSSKTGRLGIFGECVVMRSAASPSALAACCKAASRMARQSRLRGASDGLGGAWSSGGLAPRGPARIPVTVNLPEPARPLMRMGEFVS
jgi:hypothetical protein